MNSGMIKSNDELISTWRAANFMTRKMKNDDRCRHEFLSSKNESLTNDQYVNERAYFC